MFLRPIFQEAAGRSSCGTVDTNTRGFLFTTMAQAQEMLDPAVCVCERAGRDGTPLTVTFLCNSTKEMLIQYRRSSQSILIRFWASERVATGVAAVLL